MGKYLANTIIMENNKKITNNISDEEAIPYFMWDYLLTNKKIKEILQSSDEEKKIWLIAKILRDARFEDIKKLLKINEIYKYKEKLKYRLGHRKKIWDFLFNKYKEYGIIK